MAVESERRASCDERGYRIEGGLPEGVTKLFGTTEIETGFAMSQGRLEKCIKCPIYYMNQPNLEKKHCVPGVSGNLVTPEIFE